jgi:8-oxo-dGTP pyrophosphatase MutT (NUDIX family)
MFEIPEAQLPPGFADTVGEPPARPAEARPAATVVLLRDGESGPEVLLMRRHGGSGFVPGAWVFPGGRVDEADEDPRLGDRIRGLSGAPGPAFRAAALREAFEETGVLLARDAAGEWAPDAAGNGRVESVRRSLMDDEATLLDVLEALDVVADGGCMVHAAHWVTPVVESRRYDTHFFAAMVPPGRVARPDPREMTRAAWLRPGPALERFGRGELPMVFPTVRTLESLRTFDSVEVALGVLARRRVERILPRLVRTAGGVGIVVDDA